MDERVRKIFERIALGKKLPGLSPSGSPLYSFSEDDINAFAELLLEDPAATVSESADPPPTESEKILRCARNGDLEGLLSAIEAGAPIDASDKSDRMATPLIHACAGGHARLVSALLQAGADPYNCDRRFCSPMWYACGRDTMECVDALLTASDPTYVASALADGARMAALNGLPQPLERLLDAGFRPDAALLTIRTALPLACALPNDKGAACAKLLLDRGSAPDKPLSKDDEMFPFGTAMHVAAKSDSVACIQALVDFGADIDARVYSPRRDGPTPLIVAASFGSLDSLKLLLRLGADKNAATHEGASALMVAASAGHSACMQALIAAGCDIDQRATSGQWRGRDALSIAAWNDHAECAQLLLSAGANEHAGYGDKAAAKWARIVGSDRCCALFDAREQAAQEKKELLKIAKRTKSSSATRSSL